MNLLISLLLAFSVYGAKLGDPLPLHFEDKLSPAGSIVNALFPFPNTETYFIKKQYLKPIFGYYPKEPSIFLICEESGAFVGAGFSFPLSKWKRLIKRLNKKFGTPIYERLGIRRWEIDNGQVRIQISKNSSGVILVISHIKINYCALGR
jgi:hypothetical protein